MSERYSMVLPSQEVGGDQHALRGREQSSTTTPTNSVLCQHDAGKRPVPRQNAGARAAGVSRYCCGVVRGTSEVRTRRCSELSSFKGFLSRAPPPPKPPACPSA